MTEAQKEAYILGVTTGNFKGNAQKVYNLLKKRDMTTEQIYTCLESQRNELSGRISDLLDAGLIKEKSTGKYTLLTIAEPRERETRQRQRKTLKIEKWIKAGEKLGLDFSYKLKIC